MLYYGEEALVPIYIHVEGWIRGCAGLWNRSSSRPCLSIRKCAGVFLADEEDFSPSHLEQSNITRQYENVVLEGLSSGKLCREDWESLPHTQSNCRTSRKFRTSEAGYYKIRAVKANWIRLSQHIHFV